MLKGAVHEVWTVKSVALKRGHVLGQKQCTGAHKARTHGPGWRTEHASSIDVPCLIVKPSGNFCPPRAGTAGQKNLRCLGNQ